MPRQRAGQAECRRQKLACDTEAFCIGHGLKLSPSQPGAVDRGSQPAKIPGPKHRRFQNIDRFVVETFENRTSKVLRRIENKNNWSKLARNRRNTTSNQARKIMRDNELRAQVRPYVTHVDMPPVRTQRQAFEPFRTVNRAIAIFIGDFRMQERISGNTFLDLRLGLRREWIVYYWEALQAGRRKLLYCRRMKRFGVAATQGQRSDPLGIKRLPANGDLRPLRLVRGACRRRDGSCRGILTVPFLALGEVNLEAVQAGEVPRWASDRDPHFLVDGLYIAVHPCTFSIHRANRLKRRIERVRSARPSLSMVISADRKADRPGRKIEQVTVNLGIPERQLKATGIMQVDINPVFGRVRVYSKEALERIKSRGRVRIQQRRTQPR